MIKILVIDLVGWLMDNIGVPIAGGLGAGINWLFNKRKNNAETDGEIIKNFKEAIHEWKELREIYKSEIQENRVEIERLRELIKKNQIDCDNTNKLMEARIKTLEAEIIEDKKLIKELNKKLNTFETNS